MLPGGRSLTPTFSGGYIQWTPFFGLFFSVIFFQLSEIHCPIMVFSKRHKAIEKFFNRAAKGKKTLSLKHIATIVEDFARHYEVGQILYKHGGHTAKGYPEYMTYKIIKETAKFVTVQRWDMYKDEAIHSSWNKPLRIKYNPHRLKGEHENAPRSDDKEYALYARHGFFEPKADVEKYKRGSGYFVCPGKGDHYAEWVTVSRKK